MNSSSTISYKLDLVLRLPKPAVGVLNVTGKIHSWVTGPFPELPQQVFHLQQAIFTSIYIM